VGLVQIKVSVVVLTYNHERYIAQALDSVLAQRTTFAVEILVSEDCSTDGTRRVLREYERRPAAGIRLFLSEENINTNVVLSRALAAARGEYVAFLDGDDYWTSESKLQRQAEFLDDHPDCALCFHNAQQVFEGRSTPPRSYVPSPWPIFSGLDDILMWSFIPSCTPMIRRDALVPLPRWYDDAEYGDWPLYILAAQHGRLGYIDETWAVYRRHAQGYWTGQDARRQYDGLMRFFDLLERNLDTRLVGHLQRGRAHMRHPLILGLASEGKAMAATRELLRALWYDRAVYGDGARARLVLGTAKRIFLALRDSVKSGEARSGSS
jgi:glycosyltransferase involved in cell wall biosynthesis